MTYDVIVIGCGAAGVAALRKLHDAGVKAVGLEAAGRIGGRMQTVKFADTAVDLGATWCVGQKHNPVYELVKDLDLLEISNHDNNWYLRTNGELVNADTGNAILAALGEEVAEADKNSTISIAEFVRSRVSTNELLKKDPTLSKSLIEYFERLSRIGAHGDLRNSESLKAAGEYLACEGPWFNWRRKGYSTILDVLLNKYPDPSKKLPIDILLNKEVETIDWRSGQVQVKCKDGSVYTAKSVIVTVSVAVLKARHAQLFNPPLPASKVATITDLQLCQLGKIYVEFTKPWWPQYPASIKILWTNEDKAKFSGDDKWITQVYGLDTVAAQPNCLLTWVYGGGVADMEKLSEEQVLAGLEKLLDLVVKKQFDVTPIKAIIRTQWTQDALTGCAYAFRSAATEENKSGGAIELSEPLVKGGVPTVCFAGEATSHHWHHDAHGAVESGFREAQRLISSLKK